MKFCQGFFMILLLSIFLVQGMEPPEEETEEYSSSGREKETEGRKRRREEKEKEVETTVEKKKQKIELAPEEQKKVNAELLEAAEAGDLERVKRALVAGADINATKYEKTQDAEEGVLYYALRSLNVELVEFLLQRGAEVTAEVMTHATYDADVSLIEKFIEFGGDFGSIQEEMLSASSDDFVTDVQDSISLGYREEDEARASAVFLWLLLRVKCCVDDRLPKDEDLRFVLPDLGIIPLPEWLGPIAMALLQEKRDEAINEINKLSSIEPNDELKRHIAFALIHAATEGDDEVVILILSKLENFLTDQVVIEALKAAALIGQFDTFKSLAESNFSSGPHFKEGLSRALLIAATQKNVNIVQFILELDRKTSGLNLDVLSAAQRLKFRLQHPGDGRSEYEPLFALLLDYIRDRRARRMTRGEPGYYDTRYLQEMSELFGEGEIGLPEEEKASWQARLEKLLLQEEEYEHERQEQAIRQTALDVNLFGLDTQEHIESGIDFVRRLWSLPPELFVPILYYIKYYAESTQKK